MTMTDTVIRTEEWTKDMEGMISTVVFQVYAGDQVYSAVAVGARVRVQPEVAKELDLKEGREGVDSIGEIFFEWHPYTAVAAALVRDGWKHASTS